MPERIQNQLDRPHRTRRVSRRVPAPLQTLLGAAVAFFLAFVCALVTSPERSAMAPLRLAVAQRVASMPAPATDEDRCALESETVDVDDDDRDGDESKLAGDEPAPGHLTPALAFHATLTARSSQISRGALPIDTSRFVFATHLARGPPGANEATPL